MFLPIYILVIQIFSTVVAKDAECQRFKTIEVLLRYRWARTILPWTTKDAEEKGWNRISSVEKYSLEMYRYKKANNLFIFFYKNYLAGVGPTYNSADRSQRLKSQEKDFMGSLSVQVKDTIEIVKNMGRNHFYRYTVNIDSVDYNYALILFEDPSILQGGKVDPCTKDVLYFEGKTEGSWQKAPITAQEIPAQSDAKYTMNKQGCLRRFGHYYFFNLNEATKCCKTHGFFSFYDNKGSLTGFGGFYFKNDEDIYLNEDDPSPVIRFYDVSQLKEVVPHNKACITEQPAQGITATHFFIKSDSETSGFSCSDEKDKDYYR